MSNLESFRPPLGYRLLDRQVFTSNGTWTKPSNYLGNVSPGVGQEVRTIVIGGGRGGRGGYRGTVVSQPPMGGFCRRAAFASAAVPSSVSVTVGAGSAGTSGSSTTSQATAPANGGHSAFGALLRAEGGYDATAANRFGVALIVPSTGSVASVIPADIEAAGTGGGSISGVGVVEPTAGIGPSGGGTPGVNGTNHASTPTAGTAGTANPAGPGAGGGKGGDSLGNTVSGANGGAGGGYGGGGGHGGNQPAGASSGAGGNGGNGADGVVIVEVWGY